MAKRPSFQFYPGDWLTDVALRRCSPPARALWIDMLCLMHSCEPRGWLKTGSLPFTVAEIAGSTGLAVAQCSKLLAELESKGVPSRTADGVIYSRRMVRDEVEAARWRESKQMSRKCPGNVPRFSRRCPSDFPLLFIFFFRRNYRFVETSRFRPDHCRRPSRTGNTPTGGA